MQSRRHRHGISEQFLRFADVDHEVAGGHGLFQAIEYQLDVVFFDGSGKRTARYLHATTVQCAALLRIDGQVLDGEIDQVHQR